MIVALWQRVRRRPLLSLAITTFLAVVVFLLGLPLYAGYQWRAAVAALRDGRAAEARARLAAALLVWPSSVEVRLAAARAARLSGEFAETEAHLNKAMKLQNGASEATQLEFLLLRAQTGEVDEVAGALFGHVENGHPESEVILETVARAYMHQLKYGPAFACLSRWVALRPDSARPYYWRGWVLERLNKDKPAMQEYLRALELDPDLRPVRLRLAEMHLENCNPPLALAYLERLIREYPDSADVQARLGQCRFMQGRHVEARELLEAAVVGLPNDPVLMLYLAKLDLQERRPKRAEEWLTRVLKIDPADSEARYAMVSAYQQQGRTEEAAAAATKNSMQKEVLDRANQLLQAEAERPTADAAAAFEIGRTLLELQQTRLGLRWLHEALKRDARHQPSHRLLADHYAKAGDDEKAAQHRRWLGPAKK